ncbi:MAG: histidine kinase dimerization/phospho-acceptor domain-containing protein [Acetobacteraceae bacterium]
MAANEEIQRFAYIVSHDLRAPLVNIMGFTSELEQSTNQLSQASAEMGMAPALREPLIEEVAEALRFIKASTGKMDRLINAILKLSREGRRVLAPERLDMRQVFGGLVESMRHQAAQHEAEVSIGPVPNLVADRVAVEQIFSNVIDNALKYLKPGRPA